VPLPTHQPLPPQPPPPVAAQLTAVVAVASCYFQTCLHNPAAIVGGHGFAAGSRDDGVRQAKTAGAAVAT